MKTRNTRKSARKSVHPLELSRIVLGQSQIQLATGGTLVEISETGFKILLDRKELKPAKFRGQLDLSDLIQEMIWIHLDDLDLILEGTITRTRFLGKGVFEVGVDYSDTAPDYWRECLVDLLPQPNELE
jgi:recombinational DNA repair ATPase RecF